MSSPVITQRQPTVAPTQNSSTSLAGNKEFQRLGLPSDSGTTASSTPADAAPQSVSPSQATETTAKTGERAKP